MNLNQLRSIAINLDDAAKDAKAISALKRQRAEVIKDLELDTKNEYLRNKLSLIDLDIEERTAAMHSVISNTFSAIK
jgi:hypothetical protein